MNSSWVLAVGPPGVLAVTISPIFYVVMGMIAIVSLLYDVYWQNPPEKRGWKPWMIIAFCGVALVVIGNLLEMAGD